MFVLIGTTYGGMAANMWKKTPKAKWQGRAAILLDLLGAPCRAVCTLRRSNEIPKPVRPREGSGNTGLSLSAPCPCALSRHGLYSRLRTHLPTALSLAEPAITRVDNVQIGT